jgi:hypothetical protein
MKLLEVKAVPSHYTQKKKNGGGDTQSSIVIRNKTV